MNIDIINESTVVPDEQLGEWCAALQLQVHRDFEPLWNTGATLALVARGGKPALDRPWIVVLDDPDMAGALGYHETTATGLPIGKVFAKLTIQNREHVSVILSHELLELLADPHVNQ